ncbi:MAG: hypothetical protein COB25_001825 [Oceanospirillales bacterium]|jgi:hypothetical protein|nr:hypothetical protein [Oceanospirillales bacterium]
MKTKLRIMPASNKAHQFAACGRRTPFSLRLRLHYKGAVVRWRYKSFPENL